MLKGMHRVCQHQWKQSNQRHSKEEVNVPYHPLPPPNTHQSTTTNEPRHEKADFLHMRKRRRPRIVQSLYFLNPRFQASSHLLWLYSLVCVGPGRKPRRPVFSQRGSNNKYLTTHHLNKSIQLATNLKALQMMIFS